MIKKGDKLRIKKEWQDPGDDQWDWYAVDDEEKGRVTIIADNDFNRKGLIKSTQVVRVDMIEKI